MRVFLPIAWLGLLVSVALARVTPAVIGVEDIRPGMKGYGLTVFRGTEPERFDVEVIDVLHNFQPDQDLILVRTDHPVLEKALLVGGMSGSPIYLDGKLAGAYAYGWLFGKEPVAGVTPIENMLTEMARPLDPAIWKALGALPGVARGTAPPPHKPSADETAALDDVLRAYDPFGALRRHAARTAPATDTIAGGRLLRAVTPLMLAGFDPSVVDRLATELEPLGLVALQAGGGDARARSASPPHFVDGGAIGIQLIRGDIQATAIGTVTHVGAQRLVAFGHPMFNAGQVALPTATARVLHVLANERRSFKIAEALQPCGTLVHDRASAIVIDTTLEADTVPLRIALRGADGAPRTQWSVELANHRMLTPMLAFAAALNAVTSTSADRTDVVVDMTARARLAGHGTIEVHDIGYSPFGPADPFAIGQSRVFALVNAAYMNPFENVRVEGIEIDVGMRFERDVLEIVDAIVPVGEVDPGKPVDVHVTLRRFDEAEEVRTIQVPIPTSAAGSTVEITLERGDAVKLDLPIPNDFEGLLANVRAGYPATSLVASLSLPSRGLRLRGHVVEDLPGSALDMLQLQGEASRPTTFVTQRRQELALGHVVTGSAKVKVQVREEPRR